MSPAHLFEFDSLREDDKRFKIIQHYKSKDEGRKNPIAIRVSVNMFLSLTEESGRSG